MIKQIDKYKNKISDLEEMLKETLHNIPGRLESVN